MATIIDRWHTTKNGVKQRSSRYGVGKRWQVRYRDGNKQASKSFDNRTHAKAFAAQIDHSQLTGTWASPRLQRTTLDQLYQEWIQTNTSSDRTKIGYNSLWNCHIAEPWGSEPIGSIKITEVQRFVNQLSYSTSTNRKIALLMRAITEYATTKGLIPTNPLAGLKLPRQKRDSSRRYLSVHELDRLLAAAPNTEARLLVEVLAFTGIRPGEAKALKVADFDRRRSRLIISKSADDLGRIGPTKTLQTREVPISRTMRDKLAKVCQTRHKNQPLLPDENGAVWTTARWRRIWPYMLTRAGLDSNLTTYELRHTAASMAIAAGADVKAIQRMLGHSSASMTLDVYGHLWDSALDDVVAAVDRLVDSERRQRWR